MRHLLPLLFCGACLAQGPPWIPLFDGKTLNHWRSEGKAAWSVADGTITGRQGPGGGAGELLTEDKWADFELEAEWKMRFPGNSGIWFRYTDSKSAYQADILDEPKSYPDAFSGSLYCMGKAFLARNSDPSTVHQDDWNRMRIRASGDLIVIALNGKEVVRINDGTFRAAGHIGIQVHAGKEFENMEIRVRAIRLRPLQ
ncbi:MAG TPA: DUF1080 domain-containing protein [Candidatus Acidoferrales bacterium]|nr:DUF1080 domain-containing protein [Candidatus Acidoferrales bacterium]